MKKAGLFIATIMAIVTAVCSRAATPDGTDYVHIPTLTDLFARAPRTVFPLLDRNTRLDMIDYYNSGMSTPSRNMLGGESRITGSDSLSLEIAMSGSSAYRMTLLPARGDTLIALVRTVDLPTPDSDLQLFTTTWQPASGAQGLTLPGLDEWLKQGIKGTDPDVVNLLPFVTATITIDKDILTLKPSLDGRYTRDDSTKVADAMLPMIQYRWDGNKLRFKKL
ncbi:MAG: DUF3256 family protein [Muribaculum sp.]|nr:DUF3256 family protein [Muribaculum sp.]